MTTNTASNGIGANTLLNFSPASGGGTINASVNVSSVTRQSTGNYTINFTTFYADENYILMEMGQSAASIAGYVAVKPTTLPGTESVQIQNLTQGGTLVDTGLFLYVAIIPL